MFKKLVLLLAFLFLWQTSTSICVASTKVDAQCRYKGIRLYGKVKVVRNNADIKVKVVTSFPDLKVQTVEHFPDSCGKWQFVEHFPDFTVQFVDNFEDIKIKNVTSFPGRK